MRNRDHNLHWLLSNWDDPTWMLQNRHGEPVPLHFHVVLDIRCWLDEPENDELLETIKRVVVEMRTGPRAITEEPEVQRAAKSNLVILAAWMRRKNIFQFGDLTKGYAKQHLADRSHGIEACLSIPDRVGHILKSYETRPDEMPGVATLLVDAGVHIEASKVPKTLQIVREFRIRHGLNVNQDSPRDRLAGRFFSRDALLSIGTDIRRLWTLGDRLAGGGVKADPFPEGVSAALDELSTRSARTPTIPRATAVAMASAACAWVLEIASPVLDYVERQPDRRVLSTTDVFHYGIISGRLRDRHLAGVGALSASRAWRHFIPIACLVVILTFTARRGGEAKRICVGAISGGPEDGYWISLPILKSLKRLAMTPCPEVVVSAVKVLERWSEDARQIHGSDRLFIAPRSGQGFKKVHPETYINEFAKVMNAATLPDGTEWHFSLHQFRRAFVIMMVWQYEGDVDALSHHLAHTSLAATFHYARDEELSQMLSEERRTFTVAKLRAIVAQDVIPGGSFGKRVSRFVERLRRIVRISDPARLPEQLERLAEEDKITIRATPWGYCGARNTEISRRTAACLGDSWKGGRVTPDGFPDPTGSTETVCVGCFNHLIDHLRKWHWEDELAKVDSALAAPRLSRVVSRALKERRTGLLQGIAMIRRPR